VLLRYFEHEGRIRKAVSIIKKRAGRHEETIREIRMEAGGIRVGPPLREFQGVLTGVPLYRGKDTDILN
jgi:circadian clock protein KaiC